MPTRIYGLHLLFCCLLADNACLPRMASYVPEEEPSTEQDPSDGPGAGGDSGTEQNPSDGPGAGGDSGAGGGAGNEVVPIACDEVTDIEAYTNTGLPLLQSNPEAPIAIFLDFGGGVYDGNTYGPFDIDGDSSSFSSQEQDFIQKAHTWTSQYFAVFDVNVTTDDQARQSAGKWTWMLLVNDFESSGQAFYDEVGTSNQARAIGRKSSVMNESYAGYLFAHEIGHTFGLKHNGAWVNGDFFKLEDLENDDQGSTGYLMGGRDSRFTAYRWAKAEHKYGRPGDLQDSIEVIRQVVMDVGGSHTGWRKDDFPDQQRFPMCQGDGFVYRRGILERPDDVDLFSLGWNGGSFRGETRPVGVSSAQLVVDVLQDGESLGEVNGVTSLEPGAYTIRVRSNGEYAAIGWYEIRYSSSR